ncbi:MAG: NAD-glutamate dehydrogenase [Legionellales bacterium]|nr:NAD-glutamate dehydrogenase [Legionellales bacterium]
MEAIAPRNRQELLNKIEALVEKKLPAEQIGLVNQFVEQYYSTVSLEDLLDHEIMDLYGAVLSHWKLMLNRKPGETKLQIYNPDFEQHGWQSTHTVIELVQDDMPFLVDSIQMELNKRGLTTHMILHIGNFKVKRDENNQLVEVYPLGSDVKDCSSEAPIFFEIDRITDADALEELRESILGILDDVRAAVVDWQDMSSKVHDIVNQLNDAPPPVEPTEIQESIDFLRWILNNHFTFLGYREYELMEENGDKVLRVIPNTGLGVLRESKANKISRSFSNMTPEARRSALDPSILIIAKTNTKSTVHRPAYTDYIGIKVFDKDGNIIGEKRIVGLFTSAAYNRNPRDIPGLAKKVKEVMRKSRLSPSGHAGKALLNILETLPRDDLFQAGVDELLELSMGILQLQERRRIRLFLRKDTYGRFMSCLVYVPRDRYNTELRQDMQKILEKAFNAEEASFATQFSESILARIHFMIRVNRDEPLPDYDHDQLEAALKEVGRLWQDDLRDNLLEAYGEEKGNQLAHTYGNAFPAGYRETKTTRAAVLDIDHIYQLQDQDSLGMSFFRPLDEPEGTLRFKLYRLNVPMPLSDALPILENMGLRVIGEQPYRIGNQGEVSAWINDFSMVHENGQALNVEKVKDVFQEAFEHIWFGYAENDAFNKLILSAELSWREVAVIRAYTKYFKQLGITFSQQYIEETVTKHSNIAKLMIEFFTMRFDVNAKDVSDAKLKKFEKNLEEQLDVVVSLDEDRILRHFYEVILATMRTNYYQLDSEGKPKDYLSFKINPELIEKMPRPKPCHEIFVYSPYVEGVHLRSGDVARGGLRWSDRREDYRTEILGLMKAQKVKNAVIVPAGAKGGFIAKNLPEGGTREAIMTEGVRSYQTFIKALLDITDNLVSGEIIPPQNVKRYDKDDPYLVVAADKGTATFSDYANEVSEAYGHWLGDGFASGGKTGYDHKKMGITARGAWESVKRNFRELGINTQQDDFTVVGIGDMAGDVFGNGMLLSEHIRLVAAFNHMHIFIDPNPDAKASYAERKRLFELPRSGWNDYNPELISEGGGVFDRSAKAIKLTPEIKKLLGFKHDIVEPNQLINGILKAKVDLLWNGGIGTYVKSKRESNADVGDRANDSLRVNGDELNCRVVGEGGNLGLTQLARVEYALNGGKIYTDFVDNSAGVDCSDHEVNIKILLNDVVSNGDMTVKQRNQLLASMTDEVATLVLKNNYYQTQAISIAAAQAYKNTDLYLRFIDELAKEGRLDREIEFLPDEKELLERKSQDKGLTPPEIAVLMAYSKIKLKEDILNSDLPEDHYLCQYIKTAFPKVLHDEYKDYIHNHSLRREIIATQLSNMIVNDMGLTFVSRVQDETGASVSAIVRAYVISRSVFSMSESWRDIQTLDYQIDSDIQIEMMLSFGRLIRRATRWIIRRYSDLSDIPAIVKNYTPGVSLLYKNLFGLLSGAGKKHFDELYDHYVEANVPEKTARRMASSEAMFSALDIVAACNTYGFKAKNVAIVYFLLGAKLELAWFRGQVKDYKAETHWDSLAKAAYRDDIDWQQRELTISVLRAAGDVEVGDVERCEEVIEEWVSMHSGLVQRWHRMITELRSTTSIDFVMLSVAIKELLDLTQASRQVFEDSKKQL